MSTWLIFHCPCSLSVFIVRVRCQYSSLRLWVRWWLWSPILERHVRRQVGHLNSVEVGAVPTACCLAFLSARSFLICSFLCCSLCAAPVWIACLQPGLLLACSSQSSVLMAHCFRLRFKLSNTTITTILVTNRWNKHLFSRMFWTNDDIYTSHCPPPPKMCLLPPQCWAKRTLKHRDHCDTQINIVEPSVLWGTETTVIPKSTLGKGK